MLAFKKNYIKDASFWALIGLIITITYIIIK